MNEYALKRVNTPKARFYKNGFPFCYCYPKIQAGTTPSIDGNSPAALNYFSAPGWIAPRHSGKSVIAQRKTLEHLLLWYNTKRSVHCKIAQRIYGYEAEQIKNYRKS